MSEKLKISKNISNYLFLNNIKSEPSNMSISYFAFKFIRNKQTIKELKEIEINKSKFDKKLYKEIITM